MLRPGQTLRDEHRGQPGQGDHPPRQAGTCGLLGHISDKRLKVTIDSATASGGANYGLYPFKFYRGLTTTVLTVKEEDDEDIH